MIQIWKYDVRPGRQELSMPCKAQALSVGMQGDSAVLWVGFTVPDEVQTWRNVYGAKTGEQFDACGLEFVGTVQMPHGIVVHIYCEKPLNTDGRTN